MSGVLVVGEALVDVVVRSDGTVSEHPGGSPLNVAIGLARLERETHCSPGWARTSADARCSTTWGAPACNWRRESVLPVATASAAATLAPDGSATYEFDLHWELGQAVLPAAPVAVPPGRSPPSWSLGRRR